MKLSFSGTSEKPSLLTSAKALRLAPAKKVIPILSFFFETKALMFFSFKLDALKSMLTRGESTGVLDMKLMRQLFAIIGSDGRPF